MPYFENCGAQLYYEEMGSGQPLLFLHGASLDMRQWKQEATHFSKKYRVIILDARGHGKSSLPKGSVSPDVFWQDACGLLNHLNIEKAVICGLSLGGHTALQVAIHTPERVAGLILIGTPCTNKYNMYERICVPINRFFLQIMPMSWIAYSLCSVLSRNNSETKVYIKDVVSSLDHDSFNRVWKAVTSMESREGLSAIKCPTLILIGEFDTMTRRQQDYLHKNITSSSLHTIKNAHHGTNLDNPEQVAWEIDNFLNSLE